MKGGSTPYNTVNEDGFTDAMDLAIVKLAASEAIVAAAPIKRKRISVTTTWGALKQR